MRTDQGIRRATHADAELAAETLASASAEDPTIAWAISVPARRPEIMRVYYRLLLESSWIDDGISRSLGTGRPWRSGS